MRAAMEVNFPLQMYNVQLNHFCKTVKLNRILVLFNWNMYFKPILM